MRSVRVTTLGLMIAGLASSPLGGQQSEPPDFLSLDDLLNVEISSAAKYAQTTSEAAASVTIITRDEIERYGYRTVQEALSQVRGLYFSYDRNYAYLGIRGFGRPGDYNNRVLLLVNGHTLNENFYGGMAAGGDFALTLDMVERIEVVRGPGSALYGSSAMFAVVNIVSREGRDIQGMEAMVDAGSFGRKRASALFGWEFGNGVDLMVSGNAYDAAGQDLYFPEFDDPTTNHGIAEGMDFERSGGGYATLQYGPFSIKGGGFAREKAVPTAAWETVFNSEQTTLDAQWFVEAKVERELGFAWNLMVRAHLNGYHYDGVYPYEDEYTEEDGNQGRWQGVEAQFRWDLSEANRLTVGSEFIHNDQARYFYQGGGEVYFDGDFPYSLFSAFAQDELQLGSRLTVTAGARMDFHSQVDASFSPRGGLLFHPIEGTTLKALYGEAFRAPSPYERQYEDGWTITNPDLNPERVRTLEAVVEQRVFGNLFAVVSAFEYQVTDLIDQADLGGDTYQFQNQGEVEARGIEGELSLRSGAGLQGYLSYVYQSAKFAGEEGNLTNSPLHGARAGASIPLWQGMTLSAFGLYESGRITLWETETEPYTLANLTFSTQEWLDPLRLTVSARNILDESYALPGGWEVPMPAVVQDGRSFLVSVGVVF